MRTLLLHHALIEANHKTLCWLTTRFMVTTRAVVTTAK